MFRVWFKIAPPCCSLACGVLVNFCCIESLCRVGFHCCSTGSSFLCFLSYLCCSLDPFVVLFLHEFLSCLNFIAGSVDYLCPVSSVYDPSSSRCSNCHSSSITFIFSDIRDHNMSCDLSRDSIAICRCFVNRGSAGVCVCSLVLTASLFL